MSRGTILIIILNPRWGGFQLLNLHFGHPMAYLLPLEGTCANMLFYSKCN